MTGEEFHGMHNAAGSEDGKTALLAAIVDSSADAVIGKTPEGVVVSWNRAAERLFGYQAEEMIGQPISVLIVPDRLQETEEIFARIRRGERVEHYETMRRHKDGSLIHISLTVSPIFDPTERLVGISSIARDITERKRVEEQQRGTAKYPGV